MSNMNAFVVRGSDGSVNVEDTVVKFRGALEVYLAERETETALIAAAVSDVFDQYKGQKVQMPALTGIVLQKMGFTPANFAALTEQVQSYIHDNAVSEKNPGAIFKISKGKGGGVSRIADASPAV